MGKLDEKGLEAAIAEFAEFGIDFRAPWQCDLDDQEQERFDALCAAITAYLASLQQPTWFAKFNKHGECVALRKTREEAENDEGMWEGDTIVPLYATPPHSGSSGTGDGRP